MTSAGRDLICSVILSLNPGLMAVDVVPGVDQELRQRLPVVLTHLIYSQMLAPLSTCTSSGTILLQPSLSNLEAIEQTMETSFPISLEGPSPKVLTPNLPTVYEDPHLRWLTTGNCSVPSVACIPRCGMGGWHPTPSSFQNTTSSSAPRLIHR